MSEKIEDVIDLIHKGGYRAPFYCDPTIRSSGPMQMCGPMKMCGP